MPTYRTPDVYIEEISVFPPSVAEVETAIPAFVGYTEFARLISADDLVNKPLRIKSLLEFETYFGKGPTLIIDEVKVDENNNYVSSKIANIYYLYDSLRLFFDNGGGDCYIVSTGKYKTASPYIDATELSAGIDALETFDEPTILLSPDGAALSSADSLAALQQKMLSQCGKLGDRVALLDTRLQDPLGNSFRDKIGINNLKYGATYAPWLRLAYKKTFGFAQIQNKITKGAATLLALQSLGPDKASLDLMNKIDQVTQDAATLKTRLATYPNGFATAYGQAKATPTAANLKTVFTQLYGLADIVDGLTQGTPLTNPDLVGTPTRTGDIQTIIAGVLAPAYTEVTKLENEAAADIGAAYGATTWGDDPDPANPGWGTVFTPGTAAVTAVIPTGASVTVGDQVNAALAELIRLFSTISGGVEAIRSAVANYPQVYEQALYVAFAPYRNAVNGINNTLTTCPPSGAIAGIYALVDNQRGVWKAPANVSLNSVVAPDKNYSSSETDALNVDSVAGKSINAIRAFSGKGTLVWGARTLAGNDNEWRYVSVRRFFNMVEESVKKSTYWAVFEPNDANTWVKVRGMIENYLTQKWREGALAGATTKDAFFVRCGLGVTMNAQDILEGRMNVEIGMAVVRPAEFIILKFSHKLQTS